MYQQKVVSTDNYSNQLSSSFKSCANLFARHNLSIPCLESLEYLGHSHISVVQLFILGIILNLEFYILVKLMFMGIQKRIHDPVNHLWLSFSCTIWANLTKLVQMFSQSLVTFNWECTKRSRIRRYLKSYSQLPKNCFICFIENSLSAFYFILKHLFVLKIFKFLSKLIRLISVFMTKQ